ncbi:Histone-lysine N-methyltransferase setd3 [Goodea atripinnis]|uniref:Histone-lysine N-methyltransferase setd3 n=1 Tax=Goodea atripinnis TaxID=208336 RepID=A0ABV0PLI9_9TELE
MREVPFQRDKGSTANIFNPYYILKHYKPLQGGHELKQSSLGNDNLHRSEHRSPSAKLCRMKGEERAGLLLSAPPWDCPLLSLCFLSNMHTCSLTYIPLCRDLCITRIRLTIIKVTPRAMQKRIGPVKSVSFIMLPSAGFKGFRTNARSPICLVTIVSAPPIGSAVYFGPETLVQSEARLAEGWIWIRKEAAAVTFTGLSTVFEGNREDYFPDLMSWAQENGASCNGFTVANFGTEGYGLRATRDIKAEELFLWIPRKMLMTDRIMQAMGNVTLALHLLCERASPSSFWLPYIRSLPQGYDTPLYYQQDDVQLLLGTQAVQDVLSQYKNSARQYAYFYKLVQTHPAASKLPLKDSFTFDDYRSVCVVNITTGYNLEDDRCECVALQDYKENEQIYIFYGTRSNAEFVIHNGFFFQDNAHDRVKIKLGISKSERLYAMKAEVLARAGIPA